MERTVLLESGNRAVWLVLAVVFFINGIIQLVEEHTEGYRIFLGITNILLSVFYSFYFVFAFSEQSKYAAKARVTDEFIELKSSFWKRTFTMKWSDIKQIHFESYKVEFELSNGTKAFPYNTKTKESKEFNKVLRQFSESRNIAVVNHVS